MFVQRRPNGCTCHLIYIYILQEIGGSWEKRTRKKTEKIIKRKIQKKCEELKEMYNAIKKTTAKEKKERKKKNVKQKGRNIAPSEWSKNGALVKMGHASSLRSIFLYNFWAAIILFVLISFIVRIKCSILIFIF